MGFEKTALSGKQILITGAGGGIGRCCALTFAGLGAAVIAVDLSAEALASLAAESGGAIETWACDITSSEFIERVRGLERLDGLLNNAGTNRVGPMEEQGEDDIDLVIGLNIRAVYRVTQAAITAMKRAGGGSIVSISSQMGHVGSPGRTLYCMSKHAIEGMSKALAVELAAEGIRVNTVAPTFVMTPMTRPMFEDQAFSDFVMGMIPMNKLAKAEEVANACVFLLSDLSGSTTGTSLLVDGGWTAQ
ncbi:MAG: SDR family oxidoreductase [Xanthomonadales bacterium]|jgi:NAD(P)-dependent dehydrogenase (short-subunit alcohol dehydrogenase family)|nr:SDR family oxidoreductase [Xanthomonadales bacterium]